MDITVNTSMTPTTSAANIQTSKAAEETVAVSEQQTATEKVNTDTVDLSEQALNFLSEETETAETAETDYSSDESSATEDLSQYTENQLLKMVLNGEISRIEYNAEIQRRSEE